MIQEEENLERVGRTIPPDAYLDTPPHLEEFDWSYIREYSEDVVKRHPIDTRAHPVLNYAGKLRWWKKHVRTILMSSQRILGWTTGFGMSFIPTFMP